jgi:selenocysteine-specific elongation factor
VRSVQVHDRPVERAEAGQRVAIALPGVGRDDLRRGDALVEPGAYPVSYRLDVALDLLEDVPDGMRLHVHHGTAEHYARVVRVGTRYAQLRLASPAVAARGDRVVLRAGTTLGGGLVLDPTPPRHSDETRFELVERGDASKLVHAPVRADSLRDLSLAGTERSGDWVFSSAWLATLRADLHDRLADVDPLDPGVPLPSEPWARELLPLLGVELRGSKLYLAGSGPSLGERAGEAEQLERELEEAGFTPVNVKDPDLARFLEGEGRLVRLGDGLALGAAAYHEAERIVVEECERVGKITLARLRDLLETGRKPAQLILERLDADGITRRVGDERVLRRKAKAD